MDKCIGSLLYHSISFCPCSCFGFMRAFWCRLLWKAWECHGKSLPPAGLARESSYNLSKPFCSDTSHGARRQDMMFCTSFAPTWDKPSKSRRIAALGGNNIICQFFKITSAPTKQRQKNDNPHG